MDSKSQKVRFGVSGGCGSEGGFGKKAYSFGVTPILLGIGCDGDFFY